MAREFPEYPKFPVPFGSDCQIEVNLTSADHAHVSAKTQGELAPRLHIGGKLVYVSAHCYLVDGVWRTKELHISPISTSAQGPKSLYGKIQAALENALHTVVDGEEGTKRLVDAQVREAKRYAHRFEEERDGLMKQLADINVKLAHLDKVIKAGEKGRILPLGETKK